MVLLYSLLNISIQKTSVNLNVMTVFIQADNLIYRTFLKIASEKGYLSGYKKGAKSMIEKKLG